MKNPCINILFFLCFFANFAVSEVTLEYNQLALKDGKLLTFSSCSKADRDTLRIVLTNGTIVKVTRAQLTDAEVLKRCESNAVKSAWAYAEPDLIPWLFAHKREPVKKEEGGACYK